jgi:hypothetical protein
VSHHEGKRVQSVASECGDQARIIFSQSVGPNMRWVEPLAGASLMLLVLADVFLTILYARAVTGIISDRLARLIWRTLRGLARDRAKSNLLSFCGPSILVALLVTWSILLAIGGAMIVQPQLGTTITSSNHDTPTDFITAVYVAGSSLSIVGGSDFAPQSAGAKVLFLLNSVIGTSVIPLTITYVMQIYGALRTRNSLCLKIHALSGETGDAAELLAHLFADNQLSAGYNNLSGLAAEFTDAKEAHHSIQFFSTSASLNLITPFRVPGLSRSMPFHSSRAHCLKKPTG